MPFRFLIRTKLIATLLFMFLLFAVAAVYLAFFTDRLLKQVAAKVFLGMAGDVIEKMDKDIFLKVEQVQLFSQNTLLQDEIKKSNFIFDELPARDEYIRTADSQWSSSSKETVTPFMRELIASPLSQILRNEFIEFWEKKYGYRVYGEAFATNKYGVNVAQTGKTSDYYQADEEWWQEAQKNGFSVGNIEYDQSAEEWSIALGIRIDDNAGKFLGVIKAILIPQEILRNVELVTKKFREADIKLLTADGKLIYSTKPFSVLEDVSKKKFFFNIQASRENDGFFLMREEGEEKLFAYAHSKGFQDFMGLGWIFLIGNDTSKMLASVREFQNTLFFLGTLFSILMIALALVLSRAISTPIQKLKEAAQRVAEGNLDTQINIKTNDEVEDLADSFNEMALKLKASYSILEKKVRQRTEDLEKQIQELDKTAKRLVKRDFELFQTNELLRQMDKAKSSFVSIAAHQLRTPLSGIKWSVAMLLDQDVGKITKAQRDMLMQTSYTVERLVQLVGELLNVARIEEGKFLYTFEPFHIEETCRKILEENKKDAEERDVSLNLIRAKNPLPLVFGDSVNLAIVLENLIENAIIYNHKGGSVEVILKETPQGARVSIKDTGMGISSSQQNLIGQKFFRGDNIVRQQIPGTGLGLYIANKILEQHHTRLEFESKEGEGSVFSFVMPFFKPR
ncbi:MAG: sensor histidine kinase [Candidatus Spechtbacteria bacterium]|nr:sensor histidine kinase [Candidatus Spechtbacteria bacterium]